MKQYGAWKVQVSPCNPTPAWSVASLAWQVLCDTFFFCHTHTDTLSLLAGLRLSLDSWEERAAACLAANPKLGLTEVERLVTEGEALSSSLPSLDRLKEACRKAREWWLKAEALQKPENYPYLDTLEALVGRGRPLPVRLDPLQHLETQVRHAKSTLSVLIR